MEIFLIVILALCVLVVWRSGQDTMQRLREEIDGLQRDVGFLRDKLAELARQRASAPVIATTPAPAPAPAQELVARPVETAPPVVRAPEPAPAPPVPAAAQHAPPGAPPALRQQAPPPSPNPPIALEQPPLRAPSQPIAPAAPKPAPPISAPVPAAVQARVEPDQPGETRGISASLEQRLGSNWLNKLGIAILVIGLASFLAVKLQSWGPEGKVLSGFSVGLVLLLGGVWLERNETYRIFGRGGIGGGWALVFFTTYAMHHVAAARIIDSLVLDLALMLLVAAGMVAHSLRYKSQTVTGLAFLLGFVTLLTSHLEASSSTVVFSLTASVVLAVALVVVTTVYHWAWLELTGLIAVYASHFIWLMQVLPENHAAFAEFWPSTVLILSYWLIFRLAYVFRGPRHRGEENISSLSAVLNSVGVLGLLKFQSAHPEWAFWALLALGAIEMALAFRVREKRRQAFIVLSTIATVLIVSAVPFKFHGVSWPVLWLVQAQVLAICGLRLGEPVFRRLGLLAGLLTGAVIAVREVFPLLSYRLSYPDPNRHISLAIALALAAALYWIHAEVYRRRWPRIVEHGLEALALRITSWLGVAAAIAALWVILPDPWLPVGWLALMLVLAFVAHRFGAPRLALQADVVALVAAVVLIVHHVFALMLFRLDYPDPSHHPAGTAVLALAAIAYWMRAELYPRTLRPLASDAASDFDIRQWLAFTLPATSWLGAGAAAAALWVALPDQWLPIGWLALMLLLALAAHLLPATALSLEADALGAGSAVVLVVHHIAPLALFRLDYPDPGHHPALTAMLALSAAAYWLRAELYPRLLLSRTSSRTPILELLAWQSFAIPATSWLGAVTAAAAIWTATPAPWVVVGWLALVIALGLAADWLQAQSLAVQADLLAVASLCGLFFWDLWTQGRWNHQAPLVIAVALLYAGMRRKTVLAGSPNYVAPAFSWAATLLLAFTAADISAAPALTPVWAILGLALFELGRFSRKGFLRWQGYLLVALAFGRYLATVTGLLDSAPPAGAPHFSLIHSLLLDALVLASVGYLLLSRTTNGERCTRRESFLGLAADALGTLSIALWFAYRFPSAWVPVPGGETWVTPIWAAMALVLLALAWLMRRRTFLFQAMTLAVAVVARGLILDLFAQGVPDFWHSPLFHLGVTALVLLAALPLAFKLRGDAPFGATTASLPPDIGAILRHPEQLFFFSAFALEVVALAAKLTSGHITIAWSLLGLAVFLFALIVGERSFRLAGLGLLLLSVTKIIVMDIWKLSPSDRYTTLIVLGLALLLVSWLYTRFASVIRKFL